MLFLDNLPNDLMEIKVFNTEGKLQLETLDKSIDTSDWAEGIYYLQIATPIEMRITKVVVVK